MSAVCAPLGCTSPISLSCDCASPDWWCHSQTKLLHSQLMACLFPSSIGTGVSSATTTSRRLQQCRITCCLSADPTTVRRQDITTTLDSRCRMTGCRHNDNNLNACDLPDLKELFVSNFYSCIFSLLRGKSYVCVRVWVWERERETYPALCLWHSIKITESMLLKMFLNLNE